MLKKLFSMENVETNFFKIWHEITEVKVADSFELAVEWASKFAEPEDVVLLSPGCSSLDLFSSLRKG